jgi:hypothetical protein
MTGTKRSDCLAWIVLPGRRWFLLDVRMPGFAGTRNMERLMFGGERHETPT